MNFVLKVTDVFEASSKSNEHLLRIVDAKFALPKAETDPSKDFVCLSTPEYPSEHDDIVIGFENENGTLSPQMFQGLITDVPQSVIDSQVSFQQRSVRRQK